MMRFSSGMPEREGWVTVGSNVSVPKSAIVDGPSVRWRHIDGPLLEWAGQMHWLTLAERLAVWLRLKTVDEIATARWPRLAWLRDHLSTKEPHQ
jgi:hypothetical protein